MPKNIITPEQAVDFLNEALIQDPIAISSLFQIRVFCNIKTVEHKSIQVFKTAKDSYIVGLLGLINGMFGIKAGTIGVECLGTTIKKFILL